MKHLHVALVAVLAGAACNPTEQISAAPEEVAPSATTRLSHVSDANSVSWLEAPARALSDPDAVAVVSAPLTARVVRVRVRPGDHVEQGEALVEVSMPELIGAAGALSAALLRMDAFQSRLDRIKPLWQKGLVTAAEVTDLEAQIALAKADLEKARATLRAASVSDAQAKALLSGNGSLSIRAPIAGMVTSVQAKVGEMRDPGSGPMVEVVKEAPTLIEARFFVPPVSGANFEWVQGEAGVALVLEGVSPMARTEDGSRVLWLRAKDPAHSPVAQAVGRVRVVPDPDWVALPTSALLREGDQSYVFVEKTGERDKRAVDVVQSAPTETIVKGVAVGDQVFLHEDDSKRATP